MPASQPPAAQAERRKYSRHQWIERVTVRLWDGRRFFGTSFEISQGGMSAAFVNLDLEIGEEVELYPVAGDQVKAVVRRRSKNLYGFEFLNLTEKEFHRIGEQCKVLPPFQTMLEI